MSDRAPEGGHPDPDLTPAPGSGRGWTVPDRDLHSPAVLRRRRGPDLRLVPVASATWCAVAFVLVTRSWWPVLVCAAVCTVVAVTAARGGRGGRDVRVVHDLDAGVAAGDAWSTVTVARVVAVSSACAFVWAARAGLAVRRVDAHPWSAGDTRVWRGVLEIAGTPRQLADGGVNLPVEVSGLGQLPLFVSEPYAAGADSAGADSAGGDSSGDGRQVAGGGSGDPVAALLDLQPGTALEISARVQPSDRPGLVPVVLSASDVPEAVRDPEGFRAVTGHLRDGLAEAASRLPEGAAELVPGMVVGDVSGQDPVFRVEFLATGLSHLSAVSGANLSIISATVLVVCGALGASVKVRVISTALSLVAFVIVVGTEPSVLRAAVTGLVGLVAVLSSRRTHGFAACSVAVLLLLAVDPGLAVDYSFILSVVATVGIVALAPLVSRRLIQMWSRARERRGGSRITGWQAALCRLAGVSLAADVVTVPVIAHMTGVVSPTAVLANVLVGPVVPVVTVTGMLGALVAGISVPAGTVVLWVCAPCAVWITWVAQTLSGVPVLIMAAGWVTAAATLPVGVATVVAVVSGRWRGVAVTVLVTAVAAGCAAARAGVMEVGPYPWAVPGGRFGASFDKQWWEDLGGQDSGYQRIRGWTVGVKPAGSGGGGPPELLVAPEQRQAGSQDPRVAVFPDDSGVLVHERSLRSDTASGSGGAPARPSPERPDLYVVTGCGRSRGMPSRTPEGVPVAYPCRDGTVLLAPDGLHAGGPG